MSTIIISLTLQNRSQTSELRRNRSLRGQHKKCSCAATQPNECFEWNNKVGGWYEKRERVREREEKRGREREGREREREGEGKFSEATKKVINEYESVQI